MSIKSAPLKAALLPQPPRHGLEPATRNLKPVTCNLFHTHVFENKIAARLPFSNQMDSRQSNLSTTVSKPGLTQWNQILKRRGDWSPFSKKTHISSSPAPASPNLDPPTPTVFEGASPYTHAPLQALGSPLSITKQNGYTTSTLESNT